MAGLTEAHTAARFEVVPDAARLLGLDAVNELFRGFEFARLLVDLRDFLYPCLLVPEVLVGIDAAVGGVRNGAGAEQAEPVVFVFHLAKPSSILHASDVVVIHLVTGLCHQRVIRVDAIAVTAAKGLEVEITPEQVVHAGEVLAAVIPGIHTCHQAHAVVDFVPQRGENSGPKMLVVRIFDDAAAAAPNDRVVSNHNGITELVERINPRLGVYVVGDLVSRVCDGLGIVLIGIPEVVPIQGRFDRAFHTGGIHVGLADTGIAGAIVAGAVALTGADVKTGGEVGALAQLPVVVQGKLGFVVPVDAGIQDLIFLPASVEVAPVIIPTVRLVSEVLDVVETVHGQLAPALAVGLGGTDGREDEAMRPKVLGRGEEVAPGVNKRGINVGIAHGTAADGADSPAVFHDP